MGAGYQRLSGLDHAFLHFETHETPMHVALTAVFEPGSLARPKKRASVPWARLSWVGSARR